MLCRNCQRSNRGRFDLLPLLCIGATAGLTRPARVEAPGPVASQWQGRRRLRGLAEYFDVDVTFVRVAWAVLSVVPGAIIGGLISYVAAWLSCLSGGDWPRRPSPDANASCARRPTERLPACAAALPSTSIWMRQQSACSGSS